MESKIINLLQQKVIEQFALNNPIYGGSNPMERTVMDDYLFYTFDEINTYVDRIKSYTEKSKDASLSKKDRETYEVVVKRINSWVEHCFLDNNIHMKERFNQSHDVFNHLFYFEYPLSVLGIKDNEHSVFGTCFFDLCALENNKKYVYEKVKHEPLLLEKLSKIYEPLQENQKDLYFDYFKNLDRFEDKLSLVKEHIEFSHVAIGKTATIDGKDTYGLFGTFADDVNDLTKDPDSVLEKLKITL